MDEDEDIFEAENLPDYARTYALPRRMTRRKSQGKSHGNFTQLISYLLKPRVKNFKS